MARAIVVVPPTAAPTMTPVLELTRPDDDESWYVGDVVGANKGDELAFGKVVGFGELPGVGAVVVELEMPINPPGPISGLSRKNCGCEAAKRNTEEEEDSYHLRPTI